jgi:signal transduction histidine kinase
MTKHIFNSYDDLALFDMVDAPMWVFDVERHCMWWGNVAALKFWNCDSVDALVAKDYSDDSNTVRLRLRQTVASMEPDGSTRDSWTLYPGGVPTPIDVRFTRLMVGPDQHDALMIETIPPSAVIYEENDRRLVEAMRHSSIMIRYFSLDGALRFANPAAIAAFDDVISDLFDPLDAFSICLARPEMAPEMFEKCIQDGSYSGEFEVRTSGGARWHRIELRNIIDPEKGDRSILVIEEDVTSIKHAETAAAMSERLLSDAIESLSVGFIMLDADRRIVLVNEKYREMHRKIGGGVELGMPFEELLRQLTLTRYVLDQEGREDQWVQDRINMLGEWADGRDFEMADGRWIRVYESHTSNGGVAGSRMDITELKRAQKEAVEANKAKTEFLSSMSHELRTPLNSVMGFAQILEYDHGNPLNERQRYAVDMIRKSSEFLLELIKGVLDLSRIETGTIGMQIKAVNPVSIVNDSIAATQALAAARDITMIGLDSELRMKQVLLNLLSNAVKYNNDGGSVTVHAAVADHDKVRISVTDTGSGIAEDVHDKVFAPFDRLGRETLEIEGTGVGLTITKSLVEYMDGEIGFASSPGEGSTFWIEIPVWEEAPQQELRTVHH